MLEVSVGRGPLVSQRFQLIWVLPQMGRSSSGPALENGYNVLVGLWSWALSSSRIVGMTSRQALGSRELSLVWPTVYEVESLRALAITLAISTPQCLIC